MSGGDAQGPRSGRYAGVGVGHHHSAEGRSTAYLRRRFLPQPGLLTGVQEHLVRDGERLDQIATRYLGDPLLAWRLSDANATLDPQALTATPGRRLRIAMPEEFSIEGGDDA